MPSIFQRLRPWLLPLGVILAAQITAHSLYYAPSLFLDDWGIIVKPWKTGNIPWFEASGRPLLYTPWLIGHALFGENVPLYHFSLWALQVTVGVLVFAIARQFPPFKRTPIALALALLVMLYPTDYTATWLTMLPICVTRVLALLTAYLITKFANTGSRAALVVALGTLIFTYSIYEASLGFTVAWSFIVLVQWGQLSWRRRLAVLSPALVSALFVIWRVLGPRILGFQERAYLLAEVPLTLSTFPYALSTGYKVILGWGWAEPIRRFVPFLTSNVLAFTTLALVVLITCFVVGALPIKQPAASWTWRDRRPLLRQTLFAGAAGLALISAGYIPQILVTFPNLEGTYSRINFYASLGGAVFTAALLLAGATIIARSQQQSTYVFAAGIVPLVMLSIATQLGVRYDARISWEDQKSIWQDLFVAAPRFADDTTVVIVLPGYQDRTGFQNWRFPPLSASFEVSPAIQLFYGNPTLRGEIVFPDLQTPLEPYLTPIGVIDRFTDKLTPYNQTVFFRYDRASRTLTRLTAVPAALVQGATADIPLPSGLVTNTPPTDTSMRYLVSP